MERVLKEGWKDGKVGRKGIEDEGRVLKEGWKDGKGEMKGERIKNINFMKSYEELFPK